jgi:hypothetical protein
MADSGGEGSNAVSAKRGSKFKLPERAARPSDDAFFDVVLSKVERDADARENDSAEISEGTTVEDARDAAYLDESSLVGGAPSNVATLDEFRVDESIETADPPAAEAFRASSRSDAESAGEVREGGTRPEVVEQVSFKEFEKRWMHFLNATHLKLCKEIHSNTVAKGLLFYDTTARELCETVGRSKRHTFLLLQQLETMGFVRRKEIRENNRLLGIRIWFHVIPLQK